MPNDPLSVIAPHFQPPAEYQGRLGAYRSLLRFNDGSPVRSAADWAKRRREIRDEWMALMGPWPPLLDRPALEILASRPRDNFTEHTVRVQISPTQHNAAYLQVPQAPGPHPAVLCVFYDPETGAGLKPESNFRDYAYQLALRGFVTLSIGSPPKDAREPDTAGVPCQPLSYLANVAANCHTALAQRPEVDPARIGVVGHSYGGKWAMFAACLYEKFAAGVWSDPGIFFDESRPNVNYWEPWYLGRDPKVTRARGVITDQSPRTGAYKTMMERGMDLHEVQALMAPRPFLVSGGSEDPAERWTGLNHVVQVNRLLGHENRVAMTTRPDHSPNAEANAVVYAFFEHFLKPAGSH